MINILLVDDHIAVALGTKGILESKGDIKATVLSSSELVINEIHSNDYDIILLDLYMPVLNGLELSKQILEIFPGKKIIIYTGFDVSAHFNLLVETGVSGFISKASTSEQILCSIYCALRGETVIPTNLFQQLRRSEARPQLGMKSELKDITLNEREQLILVSIAEGLTNREIAEKLLYSQRSVEYILTGIFNKLDVRSRAEALMKANKHALITMTSMP
ncbi:response regulator transcription factor [Paenibacillus sp. L3-i20]|uniref:response regulator n=1 Tax=Paenibacillus sp. L3-i20 TaxID=2905833 RepID=UPI001EDCBC31|nr:response regulator transcription factor [Paenibacillus sp. L3-i20]GKU76400.1 DNA-binding response regulator [Paenibacillus sp. L3-i20]